MNYSDFVKEHPGLTESNSSYQYPYGNLMWDAEAIHSSQVDKTKIREAINKLTPNSGFNPGLIDAEELIQELGLDEK